MIWTQKPTPEALKKLSPNTMVEHLGIEFTEVGDDYMIAKMPVDHRTKQPAGLLHGGASVALAETLGSVASVFCLTSPQKMPVGIEINANHLKSATSGYVSGKVSPIRVGQNLHVWNIEIQNDKNEIVCVSRLTVMIVDRK
ncbi:hotdog fold thioesterase [Bdellovibrio sp. HCB2-146]|uniref:hotdog fold thioesterase n=1 Tax=Bdellovibrio sp. HCB2-146 TaxID=3394362 RepID=UPI0039BC855B